MDVYLYASGCLDDGETLWDVSIDCDVCLTFREAFDKIIDSAKHEFEQFTFAPIEAPDMSQWIDNSAIRKPKALWYVWGNHKTGWVEVEGDLDTNPARVGIIYHWELS